MIINTQFGLDDPVWLLHDNRVRAGRVVGYCIVHTYMPNITSDQVIEYTLRLATESSQEIGPIIEVYEHQLFSTKGALLQSL